MKQTNLKRDIPQRNNTPIFLIPEDILDTLVAKQDRILELLEAKRDATLAGYVTEKIASTTINKKTTWFWQMRKTGRLSYKKIGKTSYYLLSDIYSLLQTEQ